MPEKEIKAYSSTICRIAKGLWPDEWPEKYTGSMVNYSNWLNEKTGISEDHRNYDAREAALKAWMDELLILEANL